MTNIYRGMDRATLDAAYNNQNADPDFTQRFADFQKRSAEFRDRTPCRLKLPFGDLPRQNYDFFPAEKSEAPTYIFIHGGYWQRSAKEDFSFIAEGPVKRGFNVVMAEYTLAPDANLTQIVEEVGALLDHLKSDRDQLGIHRAPVCLSGHSAGGHLTATYRAHPLVTHAMPISALVDLEPISLCYLNDKLNLSRQEIEKFSPIHHISRGAPLTVVVGGAELPELVRHSKEYAEACRTLGEPAEYVEIPGHLHFSILEELAKPNGELVKTLSRAMQQTA